MVHVATTGRQKKWTGTGEKGEVERTRNVFEVCGGEKVMAQDTKEHKETPRWGQKKKKKNLTTKEGNGEATFFDLVGEQTSDAPKKGRLRKER